MMQANTFRSLHVRLAIVSVLAFLGMLFLSSAPAHAVVTLNQDPIGTIPPHLRTYLQNCDSYGASPAFVQWVSLASDPTVSSIVVDRGSTAPIELEYHFAGAVCSRSSAVTDTRVTVVGSAPFGVSGIDNATLNLDFSPSNAVGRYDHDSVKFTYTPQAAFMTSQTVQITLNTKVINRFTDNRFLCVPGPGGNRGNLNNWGGCATNAPSFGIDVIVPAGYIPLGSFDVADCNAWQGWTFDRDSPNTSLSVHAYLGSTFIGAYTANQSRSDVNAVFGIPGNHGFNIPVPDAYKYSNNTVTLYAIGIGTDGAPDGANQLIGTRSYSACPVPTPRPVVECSIAPISVTAGQPVRASVVFTHRGPAGAPQATVSGTLAITGLGSDVVSATLANGSSVSREGAVRTPNSSGSYTITGSFTATSTEGTSNVPCSNTLIVTLPPPVVDCTVSDVSTEESGTAAVLVSVRHMGPQYAPGFSYSATVAITSQPNQVVSGSLVNGETTILPTNTFIYNTAGVYNVNVTVTANGGGYTTSDTCPGRVTVLTRPYLRTYGNDVRTGGGFYSGTSCQTGAGDIQAFGRGSSTNYSGSGGQLAAFARGLISGYRTASMRFDASVTPQALSFANTANVNPAVQAFGGSFGEDYCMRDYWSFRSDAQAITGQTVDLGALPLSASGRYYVRQQDPSVPVTITGFVPNGRKVALFIEGNAYIQAATGGRVGYASTTWASLSDMPSLYVVALGNIGIGSNVISIDGQYIAQNTNTNNGRITTCVDPATRAIYTDNATFITACRSKLTVFGSLSAYHINFLRTFGSQNGAVANEPMATSGAAEVIQYSPEGLIGIQGTPAIGQQAYDSITALPPSL